MQNNFEQILVIWLRKALERYAPSVRVSDESKVRRNQTNRRRKPGYKTVLQNRMSRPHRPTPEATITNSACDMIGVNQNPLFVNHTLILISGIYIELKIPAWSYSGDVKLKKTNIHRVC